MNPSNLPPLKYSPREGIGDEKVGCSFPTQSTSTQIQKPLLLSFCMNAQAADRSGNPDLKKGEERDSWGKRAVHTS